METLRIFKSLGNLFLWWWIFNKKKKKKFVNDHSINIHIKVGFNWSCGLGEEMYGEVYVGRKTQSYDSS